MYKVAILGYMQAHAATQERRCTLALAVSSGRARICSTSKLKESEMWMNYEGYGMGWHWLGWLGMAFFWLIPILLVLAAVKYLMGGRRTMTPTCRVISACRTTPQASSFDRSCNQ